MSESEQEGTERTHETTETEPVAEPNEVPEGVDPGTGEVLVDDDPDQAEGSAEGDEEHRRALLAERQQAEQEEAAAQADAEKLMKQLNRTAENYAKRIVDLLGGDLTGWQPCPLCAEGLPGFRVPRMPDPEHLAQVKVAIGEDPDPDLPDDGYSRRCAACDGWGKVTTGSRVTTQKSAQCLDCKGRGWVAVGTERESGHITATNGHTDTPATVLQDNASNDPPEVAMLKSLGYIVTKVPEVPTINPPAGV